MATIDTRHVCVYSSLSANAVLAGNHPAAQEINTQGFTKALKSDANTAGFQQIESPSVFARNTSSSNRTVEIEIYKKRCGSVDDGEAAVCTEETAESSWMTKSGVEVSQYKSVARTLDKASYTDLCEGTINDVIGRNLVEMAADLSRTRNTYLATTFEANTTSYADGDDSSAGEGTEKTISLFGADATPNAMGLFKLHREYSQKGYHTVKPIIVGGIDVYAWLYAQPIFQNNVDGKDILRLPDGMYAGVDYEVDTIAQTAASDSLYRLWSMVPGHNQILSWLKFGEGSQLAVRPGESTEGVKSTIEIMGNTFDFTVSNPFCSDNAVITLGWGYDLFSVDSDFVTSSCGGQLGNLSYQLTGAALTHSDDIRG